MNKKVLILWFFIVSSGLSAAGQSGGNLTLTQSVIAAGGAEQTSGGVFSLDATTGQTLAGGNLSGGIFVVRDGFWSSDPMPSAAQVGISGRIRNAAGQGIRRVIVTLTSADGTVRSVPSGSFGYFSFDNVSVGGTYLLSVFSRRYRFDEPTRICTVYKEITNFDFIAADY